MHSLYTEIFFQLFGLEVQQRWEHQDHIPSFVHDERTAVLAADFARKLMFGFFG